MKILSILLLVTISLSAQISIENAWRNVESKNDTLKASSYDIKRSRLQEESAESMYLPSVSVSASYTHLNAPVGLDISEISDVVNPILTGIGVPHMKSEIDFLEQDILLADLQVLYPLYTGGKIDAAQDAYAARVDEAEAKHHMEKDKVFLQLVNLYYGVVMSKSLHKTRQEFQKALELHFNHAKKLKAQGQIAKAELLNAQVKFDAARIETTKAKHRLEIVTSALATMIKEQSSPKSSLFISKSTRNEHYFLNESIENYAALGILDAKSKLANASVDIEKAAWYPKVVGYANVNLYKDDSPVMDLAPSSMIGIAVKFDLFSRSDRSKEIQAAQLLHSKVSSLKAQAIQDLHIAVKKTYNEMLLYKDEFASLSSSLALAKENYKLRNLAFSEGLATSVEVVDAQMFLSVAKTKRFAASYNYVKKLAELCVLSGDSELFFKFENASKKVR